MIKEALDAFASQRAKEWAHDRTKTVGASEIGLCARRTYWVKAGAPADSDHVEGWGANLRGTVMEEQLWNPALRARFGKNLLFSGEKQKSLQRGKLSATPDGLVVNLPRDALRSLGVRDLGSSSMLVECKTVDPRVNLSRAKSANAFQVQVQLGLVRELTPHKPNYALISYTDASFWNEVSEFPIKFDPDLYESAHKRAAKILSAKSPDELQPEGWIAGGKECEYCPFAKACGVVRRSVPESDAAADPQFRAEIEDMCRDVTAVEEQIDSLQAKLREAQQAVKDRLREKGIRKIPRLVTWSAIKGRESYDHKAIREAAAAAGVDVESYSTVGEPTDRLQIFPPAAAGKQQTADSKHQTANRKKSNGKASSRDKGRH